MSSVPNVLSVNNDLPIKTSLPVHSGKVRSVYWLTKSDSARLIAEKNYPIHPKAQLAIMVISDRISAFECLWHSEDNLLGVPGKGAALNAISNHWFTLFKHKGLANSHIVDTPHPLVWIVQKAEPVMIEAIARQYLTGSMWRAYAQGERQFCGTTIRDKLSKDSRLPKLLITPSTKGVLHGIPGVPEQDDVNISRADLEKNYAAFKFDNTTDITRYEQLLTEGFSTISEQLAELDQIFVDTKFEFGYVLDMKGKRQLIYMDEVGTPDSSRIWDGPAYQKSQVVEQSKENFRQQLLRLAPDPDVLLDKNRMEERKALAANTTLPKEVFLKVSKIYTDIAEKIIGRALDIPKNPRNEIIDILHRDYDLIVTP